MVPALDRSIRAGESPAFTVAVPTRSRTSQPTSRDMTCPLDMDTRV